MIDFLRKLAFMCFLVVMASCSSNLLKNSKRNTWVFIMAGQSNMAGRGSLEAQDSLTNKKIITIDSLNNWIPASEPLHFYEKGGLDCGMSFAQALLKDTPRNVTIAMVPCAVGGSSVFQWLNDKEHRGVKLLSNFKEKVELAKAKGEIKGILWHQGESNAKPNDFPVYQDSLLALFDVFRSEIGSVELPIMIGELGRFAQPEEKAGYFRQINLILADLAQEEEYCYLISSEGLDHKGDNLHFNSTAQRELGRRYADAIKSILINEHK
ncbi:MAG: sialate O-acetylesterase [Cyclobacteriaceae bacterium]